EKDGRRIEVVAQKTKETAGQRDCGKRQRNIVLQQSGYQRRYGGEQADSSGQTIDAVDQVHGIGAADQPQHGKRKVQPNRDGVTGDCIDVHASPVCEERSTDLAEELLPGLQANQVIDEADEKNQGGGRRHSKDDWQRAGNDRAAGESGEQQYGEAQDISQDDGDTADARNGMRVKLPGFTWLIHNAEAPEKITYKWRQQ